MQKLRELPRDTMTDYIVQTTLSDLQDRVFSYIVEAFDPSRNLLGDVTTDIAPDWKIERDVDDPIGTSLSFLTRKRMDWGSVRLRFTVLLSGRIRQEMASAFQTVTVPFRLGWFLPESPRLQARGSEYWSVTAYDPLTVLSSPRRIPYSIGTDITVLNAIMDLIREIDTVTPIILDPTKIDAVHPTGAAFDISSENSRLAVINTLLKAVGYRHLSVDWDGSYVSGPISDPNSLTYEWIYSTDDPKVKVAEPYELGEEYHQVPNVVAFVSDSVGDGFPDEGSGLVTYINQSDGPWSIDARGREIFEIRRVTAIDQTTLQQQADRQIVLIRKRVGDITINIDPNPLHWGFPDAPDRVLFSDSSVPLLDQFEVHHWSLDGSTGQMQLQLRPLGTAFVAS